MSYDSETARRYRAHAGKLRSLAAGYDDKETVEIVVGVARDYERMADVCDGIEGKKIIRLKAS